MTATSFVGCGSLYAQQYDRPNIIVFIVEQSTQYDKYTRNKYTNFLK